MDPSPSPSSDGVPEPAPARVAPPRWGIGDFLWIYVVGIVGSFVGASIGFAFTHDTSDHVGALTTALSLVGQFGTWFACVFYVARQKGRSARADFGAALHWRDWWVPLAGIVVSLVANVVVLPLVSIANAHQNVVNDLDKAGGAKLTVLAVTAALIAPVCEELLFRGVLLRALRRRMSPEWAVVVQALAFAFAHPMLSPTLGDLAVVPGLFLFGAVSGVVALRSDDLSKSILLHVGFNLLATLSAL